MTAESHHKSSRPKRKWTKLENLKIQGGRINYNQSPAICCLKEAQLRYETRNKNGYYIILKRAIQQKNIVLVSINNTKIHKSNIIRPQGRLVPTKL